MGGRTPLRGRISDPWLTCCTSIIGKDVNGKVLDTIGIPMGGHQRRELMSIYVGEKGMPIIHYCITSANEGLGKVQ